MSKYSEKNIVTLEPLEALRTRHGMYMGATGSKGITHIVKELVSNAIDEFIVGYGTRITVESSMEKRYVRVTDEGRGIPHGKMEEVFTIPHTSGKIKGKSGYSVSGGLNG